ncbi:MAG: hypothetical protein HOV92_00740 [Streptomyces sp.]|nr:hypothetical protein [Streptomyces sp.]
MDANEIESLLQDCIPADQDDPDNRGYQSSGITKLAALLAGYEQRIVELEKRLGDG